jgi:muramoyltetrapeptide carboxypeptidase
LIKKNPKIFVGYSDNTILHYALQSQANLATYYGPCVMTQFGEYPKILGYTLTYFKYAFLEDENKTSYEIKASELWTEEFLDWFKKEDEKRPRKTQKNSGYEWLVKGQATGELLGGAIVSINHLVGTKYWCNSKDKIFFLDIPEGHVVSEGMPLQEVDSYLADLDNLGLFESISGLIIGRPYHYSSEQVKKLKQMILNYTGKKKCPVLYNANIGHTDPIVVLRYGAIAEIDSNTNTFRITG